MYKGAAIFYTDGHSVLLLRKSGIETNSGTWGFPGGHPKPGEQPWQTAVRETREETGHAGGVKFASTERDKYFVFFLRSKQFSCKLSKEHSDWKWVRFEDLKKYKLHPKLETSISEYVKLAKTKSNQSFREWLNTNLLHE